MPNKPNFVQIESDKSFVRDTQSNALLNTDQAALSRNRANRSKATDYSRLKQRVDTLQQEVSELKTWVQQQLKDHACHQR